MIDGKLYDKLIKECIYIMNSKGADYGVANAHDIVHSAFVNAFESGEISYSTVLKKVKRLASHPSIFKVGIIRNFALTDTNKFCKKCNEVLPISAFTLARTTREGKESEEILPYCRNCQFKIISEYRKTDKYKSYISTNLKDHSKYVKGRYNKDKEELSDRYIIKLLRHKYSMDHLLNHPELISEHRIKIAKKRKLIWKK
jgi:hypothetical protein